MPKPNALPETRMFRQIKKKNAENGSMSVPPSTANRSMMNSQNDSDYSMTVTPDVAQQQINSSTAPQRHQSRIGTSGSIQKDDISVRRQNLKAQLNNMMMMTAHAGPSSTNQEKFFTRRVTTQQKQFFVHHSRDNSNPLPAMLSDYLYPGTGGGFNFNSGLMQAAKVY